VNPLSFPLEENTCPPQDPCDWTVRRRHLGPEIRIIPYNLWVCRILCARYNGDTEKRGGAWERGSMGERADAETRLR
jgi:hypothetical protein